ncbi:hypothetical protein HAX54_031590 [Datura stramonium]|uniref:N-acetyltransferase domain-containing protein n=1 Tax=Datura stramonium TaxID=4076 RepID=A0ABS8RL72_DATST|nr:hypothetical protein [Datura stramonium]
MDYLSRISLRSFKISDADDLLKWASDENVTYYLRWNTITTIEAASNYIQQVAIPHRGVGPCAWMIGQSDTHQLGLNQELIKDGYPNCVQRFSQFGEDRSIGGA